MLSSIETQKSNLNFMKQKKKCSSKTLTTKKAIATTNLRTIPALVIYMEGIPLNFPSSKEYSQMTRKRWEQEVLVATCGAMVEVSRENKMVTQWKRKSEHNSNGNRLCRLESQFFEYFE